MSDTGAESSDQDVPERSPARTPGTIVDVSDALGLLSGSDAAWLGEHVERALGVVGVEGEVRIRLVDDARMAQEHERWLDDPTTTDVLTFDLREEDSGPLDTDLVLCVDQARREADAHGHAVRSELLLYAVHGVLHCTGYDDQNEDAAARMHAEEDRVLEAVGVGAVYRRGVGMVGGVGGDGGAGL